MTTGQHIGYFLSEWIVAWLILFIPAGAVLNDNHWLGGFYGLAAWCVCCAPSWSLKLRRVKQSRARVVAAERIRAGVAAPLIDD